MSENQSGWQQRIAAMEPWVDSHFGYVCYFCGIGKTWSDAKETYIEETHKPDCLWQHAKDALPPSSSEVVEQVDLPADAAKVMRDNLWTLATEDALPPAPPAEQYERPDIHTGDDPRTDAIGEIVCACDEIEQELADLVAADDPDVEEHESTEPIMSALDNIREALKVIDPIVIAAVRRGDPIVALPPAPEASPARFCECIGVAGHPNFVRTQHGRSVCVHCDLPRRADASPAKETS